jgi:hypothetical protein
MLIEAPTLVCCATGSNPPKIVPARANRDWMDAAYERFAHRPSTQQAACLARSRRRPIRREG